MKTESRIKSILQAKHLDYSVTGFEKFDWRNLIILKNVEFELPQNIRLGHLAEKVFSFLISASENYRVLHENIQIIEEGKTIGEIDFIIEEVNKQEVIHVELAYKFYLYDSSISSKAIQNWIGPNRNDSLIQKLEKLKKKQFPLLQHQSTVAMLPNLNVKKVQQALCFIVSLYLPYHEKINSGAEFDEATKGYYLDLDTFLKLQSDEKKYFLPPKLAWGMDPAQNTKWRDLVDIKEQIQLCLKEKKAPLVWQKYKSSYLEFFIVWW